MFNTAACTSSQASLLTRLRLITMVLATWVPVTRRLLVQAQLRLQLPFFTQVSIVPMGPLELQPHTD